MGWMDVTTEDLRYLLPTESPFWGGEFSVHRTRHIFLNDIGDVDTKTIFQEFSALASIEDVRNYRISGSHYVSYVDFKHPGEVNSSLAKFDFRRVFGHDIKPVFVKGLVSRILWVGNINEYHTERELEKTFSKYGRLAEITVRPAARWGFVVYEKLQDAMRACVEMQGQYVLGERIVIDYGRAEEERVVQSTLGKRPHPREEKEKEKEKEQERDIKFKKLKEEPVKIVRKSTNTSKSSERSTPPASPMSPMKDNSRHSNNIIGSAELVRSNVPVCTVDFHAVNFPVSSYSGLNLPPVLNVTSRTDLSKLSNYIPIDKSFMIYLTPSAQDPARKDAFKSFCDYMHEKSRAGIIKSTNLYIYIIPMKGGSAKIFNIDKEDCLIGIVVLTSGVNEVVEAV